MIKPLTLCNVFQHYGGSQTKVTKDLQVCPGTGIIPYFA